MGLKRNDYTVKGLGIILPTAYAFLKNLKIDGENAKAEFYVQANRENAKNLEPLEIKTLRFKVDRNKNPYETAYIESKKQVEQEQFNLSTSRVEKVIIDGIFTGWTDDIV